MIAYDQGLLQEFRARLRKEIAAHLSSDLSDATFLRRAGLVAEDGTAVAQRLVGVRAVPGLRRRDSTDHLLHQRDREPERPLRRAVRARGHFPNDQAALKCLYLVTRSLDPTGKGKARWAMRWKPALNAFAITFEGRINPAGT
jgi:hypothetical protein